MKNKLKENIIKEPKNWLVTGGAGFIGSNLVQNLLMLDQNVTVLDNFSTGSMDNIDEVKKAVGSRQKSLRIIHDDIRNADTCMEACCKVDFVLHQAALGSVPLSIEDPQTTHAVNVDGFVNMLIAAREKKVKRFIYASSSSVYGDLEVSPKKEDLIGKPISPYAVSKLTNELYAQVFSETYDMHTVGLRYFNVFGPRQNPNGAYAAVIARWLNFMLDNIECTIFGDGETSRDFCYVENVVQANLLAATMPVSKGEIFNIACNSAISLNTLYEHLRSLLTDYTDRMDFKPVTYKDFRNGDIKHSLADINKAQNILDYQPEYSVLQGLEKYVRWAVDKAMPIEKTIITNSNNIASESECLGAA